MSEEQRTRALLSPADPTRAIAVPPARLSAVDLIARAEAEVATRPARPTRRLVLAAAGAVAISAGGAAAAYPLVRGKTRTPAPVPRGGTEPVLVVPIAYQINTDAPAAGPYLRELAAKIGNAPCDLHSGRYVYHHRRTWGEPVQTSPEGYSISHVEEMEVWVAADGSGRQRVRTLGVEFPDAPSRQYWQSRIKQAVPIGTGSATDEDYPAGMLGNAKPLPTNQADLASRLGTGSDVPANVSHVYQQYAVPRATRVAILSILAGLPGLLWRGQVSDRAGRTGLAVTYDDPPHGQQQLLVFDPKTGELLADELLNVGQKVRRVDAYLLFLGTDRTNQFG